MTNKATKKRYLSSVKFIFNLLVSTINENSDQAANFKINVKKDVCLFDVCCLWLASRGPYRYIQRAGCGHQTSLPRAALP